MVACVAPGWPTLLQVPPLQSASPVGGIAPCSRKPSCPTTPKVGESPALKPRLPAFPLQAAGARLTSFLGPGMAYARTSDLAAGSNEVRVQPGQHRSPGSPGARLPAPGARPGSGMLNASPRAWRSACQRHSSPPATRKSGRTTPPLSLCTAGPDGHWGPGPPWSPSTRCRRPALHAGVRALHPAGPPGPRAHAASFPPPLPCARSPSCRAPSCLSCSSCPARGPSRRWPA